VANAIIDGTDFVMLSAETAVGKYPVATVAMMKSIVKYTEDYLRKQ
jgi:pyruvate kinase